MTIRSLILLLCLLLAGQTFARDYDIFDYGASRDSAVLQSLAINAAINACAENGGGRVVVPAGKYRCGTIFLRDNVELHLAAGATLFATEGYDAFPMQPRNHYRSQKDKAGWNALIYAANCENIAITGHGTIDGRGHGRRGYIQDAPGDGNGRPKNILLISCRKVRVSGVTMLNSALWNQHYLNCEDVTIDDIHVYNHCNGNNDGIDIDGCRRFILTNSIIDSDDDGIVLKSTGMAPCEDVVIRGCIVSSFANAIKCGTESVGGYRNILISDCLVRPSRHAGDRIIKSTPTGITAISLEMVDGGVMEHVTVNNILIDGTECPLYIRLANRGRRHIDDIPPVATESQPTPGTMRDITISNVTAYNTGNFTSSITGIPGARIENVRLQNIHFQNRGGLEAGNYRSQGDMQGMRHDMAGQVFPTAYWRTADEVEEDERGYPQPTVWGNLPCYGLFVRHVRGFSMNNVTFSTIGTEPRSEAVMKMDVEE